MAVRPASFIVLSNFKKANPMKKQFLQFSFALGSIVLAGNIQAQLLFLEDTVLGELTAEEIASFKAFARTALDSAPDMQLLDWESPDGGKTGKLMTRFSYQSAGTTCRRAFFQVAERDGRAENYRFDLCRQPDGWLVVEATANFSTAERRELEQFIDTVVENEAVGVPVTWSGSRSGHNAVVVPLPSQREDSPNCRRAAVTLIDRGGSSISGQYLFCRETMNDRWVYSQPVSSASPF